MTDKKGFAERASIIKKIRGMRNVYTIIAISSGLFIAGMAAGFIFYDVVVMVACYIFFVIFCFLGYSADKKINIYLEKLCEVGNDE